MNKDPLNRHADQSVEEDEAHIVDGVDLVRPLNAEASVQKLQERAHPLRRAGLDGDNRRRQLRNLSPTGADPAGALHGSQLPYPARRTAQSGSRFPERSSKISVAFGAKSRAASAPCARNPGIVRLQTTFVSPIVCKSKGRGRGIRFQWTTTYRRQPVAANKEDAKNSKFGFVQLPDDPEPRARRSEREAAGSALRYAPGDGRELEQPSEDEPSCDREVCGAEEFELPCDLTQ